MVKKEPRSWNRTASPSRSLSRSVFAAACLLAFVAISGCSSTTSPSIRPESREPGAPVVSGTLSGPKEVVFDTRNSCEQIDIPDAPARAFRDSRGFVHLFSTHYVARAMIGPDLDHLKRDCRVVYRSPKDADPADFQYNNWLFSFYTEDGLKVASLVHSEYDADEIPGKCATLTNPNNCWWNTITFAQSQDGGYSFSEPLPPANLVAAVPYRYQIGNLASAYGYNSPGNVLKVGSFYYALINDWPFKLQQYGPCLIRTQNVFDPGSWRAWDGKAFSIRFADPYREAIANPEQHICVPVLAGNVDSLVKNEKSGVYVATQFAPDDRFGGPPGFYVQGSRDLTHWSTPSVLAKISDILAADSPGKWTYSYESLIDPASPDRNFSTVSDNPYLYYVRSDGDNPPYARVLFRRQVRLQFGGR